MKDNEIIKALECVIGNDVNCSECTYQKVLPFPSCRMMCARNALDLINRQKEKIKEFYEKLVIRRGLIDYQKAEIEQWKEEANKYQNLWCIAVDDIEKVKSEAIKEFAERLKKEATSTFYEERKYVDTEDIDNLVKEMEDKNV